MGFIPFLKEHKKRTVPVISLWDTVVSCFLEKDVSTRGVMRRKPFYMDLKGFYSGTDNVTYMYTIDGYPAELEVSYRSLIRRECKAGVRISFVSLMDKHKIDWDSQQMKSKLKTWKILDEDTDDVDEYNYHSNLSLLDSQARRKDSLIYLSSAELRRKRKTFKLRGAMFISGVRGESFDDTIKEVDGLCRNLGIKVTRVMINIEDYLSVFSPFSCSYNAEVLKSVGSNVLTDELIARLSTYSQGTVGIRGLYWGTDIYSGFPCLKQTKRTDETAENWLITAETEGGKSYFVKNIILQLLANMYVNGTIMDIEGFEYLPIAEFIALHDEVVVLNMAEGTGAFFDPVPIVLTGDVKLDKDMYRLSYSYTLALFKTFLGSALDDKWVDIIIKKAITKTYQDKGVYEERMNTWANSKDLSVKSIYETLLKFEFKTAEQLRAYELVKAILFEYFDDEGSSHTFYTNRVTVEQISTAKLVVCSFGMAGKTEKSVDEIQMALMQLTASIISHLRSVFSKRAGKFNFKLWEEFQRWGKFPNSDKTIGTAITGGRKLGDINIIVTNVVKELLDDDRFGIFGNIQSLAIGAIGDSDVRKRLCDRLSIPSMLPELDKLVVENKDKSAFSEGDNFLSNPYNKAFLIGLDRTVYTISRMSLPSGVGKSKLFRTGVDLADSKEGEKLA